MPKRFRLALLAALTICLAAGCANTDSTDDAASPGASASPTATATAISAGPPWYDDVAPAVAGGTFGVKDTPCDLGVTFDVPAKWKVKPVTVAEEWADLVQTGGMTLRCEIDGKPIDRVGFLRVWTLDKYTSRKREALERFLADYGKLTEVRYRDTKAGPIAAIEATFLKESELTGETVPGRAMLVPTRLGTVLLTLSGIDTEAVQAMMPTYQLAKQSFAVQR